MEPWQSSSAPCSYQSYSSSSWFGGGLIFYSKKIGEATADGGSRIDDNKPQAGSIDVWYNIAERPDYQKTVDYSHKLAKETKQTVENDEKAS